MASKLQLAVVCALFSILFLLSITLLSDDQLLRRQSKKINFANSYSKLKKNTRVIKQRKTSLRGENPLFKFIQGAAAAQKNLKPVIGVFSMHCHMQSCLQNEFRLKKYDPQIPASYVKFIESAGARVVPISFRATRRELDQIFAGNKQNF